jgi:phosphatidylglycerol lysyltransferase
MTGHHYDSQEKMGSELCGKLLRMASDCGICSDSFLVTELDRSYFWSPDHTGVIGYIRIGKHFKVVGGVLAPPEEQAELLRSFVEFIKRQRGTIAFINVGENAIPLFEAENFSVTKWGEEAVLDLPDRTWRGKSFERMRQQVNHGRSHGLVASEIRTGPAGDSETARLHAELDEVANLAIGRKPQSGGTRAFQALLAPERATGQRIFCARADGGKGRIEAFIVCFPGKGGMLWSTEVYRFRPDCIRNALVFLIHKAAEYLKAEGASHLTVGFIPGLRCDESRKGEVTLIRRGILFAWNHLGFVMDLKSLYAFKNRFRPRYEKRYVCAWPGNSLCIGSTIAFIRLWGGCELHPLRVTKVFFRQAFLVRRERKSLVKDKS